MKMFHFFLVFSDLLMIIFIIKNAVKNSRKFDRHNFLHKLFLIVLKKKCVVYLHILI